MPNSYGQVSHLADLEQLPGLGLQPLRSIHEHECVVYGGEGPVCVFAEVLMSGSIEQVELYSFVFESHGCTRDGYSSRLFDFHPVRGGMSLRAPGLDCSGFVDGPSVQQKFFGEGGLSGVGMADDSKRSASAHLFTQLFFREALFLLFFPV
eukprot:scaffold1141_cov333-Pavlova_lutheri.AAC.42